MKFRLTISRKIALWFLANLLLLLLAGWLLIRWQFASGVDSFLSGYVGQRLEAVARRIIAQLNETPRDRWNEIIGRESEALGVKLMVLDTNQRFLAGEEIELPEELKEALPSGRGPPPPGFGGARENPGGPRGRPRREEGTQSEQADEFRPARPRRPAPVHHRFFLPTDRPAAYWAGLYLSVRRENLRGPQPVVFVARAETFTGGGLFFDVQPWLVMGGVAVLLSVFLWLPLVKNLTGTVRAMTKATGRVADGDFNVKVEEERTDELGELAGSINRMTARLDGFVSGQKRFLGDIAHELSAPVARMQMALGILEMRATDGQQQYVSCVNEELQHVSTLIRELVSVSKTGMGGPVIELKEVELRALIEALVRRETEGKVPVRNEVREDVKVRAEPDLLGRAIGNILRNSVRYGGESNEIAVTSVERDGEVELVVADTGPGVPEEDLLRLFDPFYRVDQVRTPGANGTGLGLAIVKTCLEACQGSVTLANREPRGLEVRIRLKPG